MPLQNRVTPLGELVATPERGLVYGNRGCLHDERGRIRRAYATQRWIACRLEFRGRRRTQLMAPGRYTELFFLDEATAMTAGHRPCAECRREDYVRFKHLWSGLHAGQSGAEAMDAQLHAERLVSPRERRLHEAFFTALPDGVFVLEGGRPRLLLRGRLLAWSPAGYLDARRAPRRARATVLTPPSLAAVLEAGWGERRSGVPFLHPTASELAR